MNIIKRLNEVADLKELTSKRADKHELLGAFCTSHVCEGNTYTTTKGGVAKPLAKKTDIFCYDCGSALYWRTKDPTTSQ